MCTSSSNISSIITQRARYQVQIWVFGVQIYSDITWFNNCIFLLIFYIYFYNCIFSLVFVFCLVLRTRQNTSASWKYPAILKDYLCNNLCIKCSSNINYKSRCPSNISSYSTSSSNKASSSIFTSSATPVPSPLFPPLTLSYPKCPPIPPSVLPCLSSECFPQFTCFSIMCFSLVGSKHFNISCPHNLWAFLPAGVGSSPCLFSSTLSIWSQAQ